MATDASPSPSNPPTTPKPVWPTRQYTPRAWLYTAADFTRQDSSSDSGFYRPPRFVTHIDDAAIKVLRDYFQVVLPRSGRILDFCSSWVSHYPESVEAAAREGRLRVTGMGMNQAELDANEVLNHGRIVKDLNEDADVLKALTEAGIMGNVGTSEEDKLDAATNIVSIDYLTKPVEVLKSLRSATKSHGEGRVHLVVSNRCFPTKAISRWLRVDEEEKLQMVGDFLHFAGWSQIEIVELSNGGSNAGAQGFLSAFMRNQTDPLWVVRAVND